MGCASRVRLIVTQLGTALVLYPIARWQSETIALSYVTARTMESVFAAIGLVSMLSLISVIGAMNGATGSEAVRSKSRATASPTPTSGPSSGGPGSSPASVTVCCSATSCTSQPSCPRGWRCWV